jgi:hypothetical protein
MNQIMRKTGKLLTALLTVFSAVAFASPDSVSLANYCKVIEVGAQKQFKLIYQSPLTSDVQVDILDPNNTVVLTEEIERTDGFVRHFDLRKMENGQYRINVTARDFDYESLIKVEDWTAEGLRFIPTGNKVAFIGSNDSGDDITLFILDDDRNPIHQEEFSKDEDITKIFNLEQVKGENVVFMIFEKGRLAKETLVKL